MQLTSFSVLALLFSVASAFTLSARQQGAPSCALTCLATTPTAPCGSTNNTCLCHDETFLKAQLACVEKSCTGSDFAAAQQFAVALCQQVGVDLTTDTNLIPASTTSGASSTANTGGGSTSAPTTSGANTGGGSASAPTATSPAPSTTSQTSGALSLDIRAAGALLLSVAGIALTL